MCVQEGKKLVVDLYAWGVGDAETAGAVGAGEVEFEFGVGWVFGRCGLGGCSVALSVHAIDPDDWSSSNGELAEQVGKQGYEWFWGDAGWTEKVLLEVDEEEG